MEERLCAYELCEAMEDLRMCPRCKGTWYCSQEHQKRHWTEHSKSCKISTPDKPGVEGKGECSVETPCKEKDGEVILSSLQKNSRVESNKQSDVDRTKLQEDIAQFSANIRQKHSCNLTPRNNEEEALMQEVEHEHGDVRPVETNQERENMPPIPNQPNVLNTTALYVSEHMRKFGICVLDKFLQQEIGDAILEEVKLLRKNDAFHNGQLVTSRENGSTSSKDIRGDKITWTDGHDPETKNIGLLISQIDLIVCQCKGHLDGFKNIKGRTEAMVACYPGNGTHYVKHVDNPNDDGRCITCIYYLNKDWDSKKMGGSLRLYPRCHNMMANVEPIFNRLILFWSDRRNPHEVMPAHNTRYAITVWYLDVVEKKKELAS